MKFKVKLRINDIDREIGIFDIPNNLNDKFVIMSPNFPELRYTQFLAIELESLEGNKKVIKTISFGNNDLLILDDNINAWLETVENIEIINIQSYSQPDYDKNMHYRVITYRE